MDVNQEKRWNELRQLATKEIETILAELPAPLQERAALLPVTFESAPSAEMQADGIEHDTLGLFAGGEMMEEDNVPMPAQIILYLENLWDYAGSDKKVFREEVRTTFLHELGHFFGLDEDDLTARGLD